MNRIYQGRVSGAQLLDPKDGDVTPSDWDWTGALWQHHALFQDAVNYYLVCLLALAGDTCAKQRELREKMTRPSASGADDPLYVWERVNRRGVKRPGLRASVARYLCPDKADPSPDDCFAAVLAGNECAPSADGQTLLDRGLRQLLNECTGASGCKQAAPVFLPRFCKPAYQGSYGEDASTLLRDYDASALPFLIHDPSACADAAALDRFGVHSIALPNEKKPMFTSTDAVKKLRGMVAEWRKRQPESEADWARLEDAIAKLPADVEIPGYVATSAKNEVKFRLFAMFFFKHVERSEFTLGLLRATTRAPKPNEILPTPSTPAADASGDPIRRARGSRGFVFRAFTSLACWGGDESGAPQWIEFDFAAFEEALKALHQVDEKAKEREVDRAHKQARHDYQRGNTRKWKGGVASDEEHRPPVLAGDPRIARLAQVVDVELRAEYEMSEGVEVKYGLHPRTIRGFRDVRTKWNEHAKSAPYSAALRDQLLGILRDFQKDNATIIGSARLFEVLLDEPNWLIWREPSAEQLHQWGDAAALPADGTFCTDPLQALTDERELLEEIERLREPIRLTPADPEHSRRQFYLSDVSDLTKKGRLRHDRSFLESEIAEKSSGVWVPRWVRIHFTAPRLLRDQITSDAVGRESAWQQAMMTALGLKAGLTKKGKPATFAECAAVALMPETGSLGEKRILLNFPLTLDDDAIARQLGKAVRWDANQFGPNFKNSSWLRWPSTRDAKARSAPWWESDQSFCCLSVDLGQRDAGAFALLEVTPGKAPKPQSRQLGEAEGKTWWATVQAMGLLRLPGEDARVWRASTWQQEFSGERGRSLVEGEWEDACSICAQLGFVSETILGEDRHRHSFPELNNELLYALRRAQSRLARLQSWSSLAHPDTKPRRRDAIVLQIKEANDDPLGLKPLVAAQQWPQVAETLCTVIVQERDTIKNQLVRIADRIQPLRSRRWEWVQRDDGKNYFLRQTRHGSDDRKKLLAGQRGLSMERIEQLETLRQRCQSLNRALQQTPGEPARLGRNMRGIELPDPCPELLDRLDALKDQRVNQTAHLILAQALGVRLKSHTNAARDRAKHDIHGEYEPIPGRAPVDFIVLENLDRYLAAQGRSRAENSRLMKWCHRQLLGKLQQLCEPYGLRVLETPAAYSSKFCSLSGVAGFRAVELTPDSAKDFRWKKHLDRLRETAEGKRALNAAEHAESTQVKALFDALEKLNDQLLSARDQARREGRSFRPKWRTLIAPETGGPIFVPMHGKPMQADINAAINVGLRALAAPDNATIHVRIRSERVGETFFARAGNLREKARWPGKPPQIEIADPKRRSELLTEAHPNFFADVGRVADFDQATIVGTPIPIASGRGIWGTIRRSSWSRVGTLNNDRVEKAGLGRLLPQQDDVPM